MQVSICHMCQYWPASENSVIWHIFGHLKCAIFGCKTARWDRWSTWPSSRNCLYPERFSTACSIPHTPVHYTITLRVPLLLFDCSFVILSVIKKQLHLILRAFNVISLEYTMIMLQHFVSLTFHQWWTVALCKWLTLWYQALLLSRTILKSWLYDMIYVM